MVCRRPVGRVDALVVLLAAALLGFAGCSDDDAAEPPSTSTTTSSPSTTSSEAGAPSSTSPTTTEPVPPPAAEVFTDPDEIRDLATDSAGRIWAVGPGGATSFDPATGEITTLTVLDGLPSHDVWSVAIGDDDVVWLATDRGLASVDGGRVSTHGAPPVAEFFDPRIWGLDVGPEGDVWTTQGADILRYDGDQWEVVASLADEGFLIFPDVAVAPNGDVWVSSLAFGGFTDVPGPDFGIARIRGAAVETFSEFGATEFGPLVGSPDHLDVAPDGAVWVVFESAGPGPNGGVATFRNGGWTAWSSADVRPGPLAIEGDGTVWVTSDSTGGDGAPSDIVRERTVSRLDGAEWIEESRLTAPLDLRELYWPAEAAVARDGEVWTVGGRGLTRWSGGEPTELALGTTLMGNDVTAIDVADDGTTWVLSDRALHRIEGSRWTSVPVFARYLAAVSGTEAWGDTRRFSFTGDSLEVVEVVDWGDRAVTDLDADGSGPWLATDLGPARISDGQVVVEPATVLDPPGVDQIHVARDGEVWALSRGEVIALAGDGWGLRASGERALDGELVVADDDTVWAIGGDLVARFVEGGWTTWSAASFVDPPAFAIPGLTIGPDGVPIIGTQAFRASANAFDPRTYSTRLWYLDDEWVPLDVPPGVPPEPINAVAWAPDGSLWAGTLSGLVRLGSGVVG